MKNSRPFSSLLVLAFTIGLLMMIGLAQVQAAPSQLPLADDEPEATPTVLPPGRIELRVKNGQQDWITVVQWQDGAGDWHDVDSWRGNLDDGSGIEGNKINWGVMPENFHTGPFRWVVYDQTGQVLAVSQPFFTPSDYGETVVVELTVPAN